MLILALVGHEGNVNKKDQWVIDCGRGYDVKHLYILDVEKASENVNFSFFLKHIRTSANNNFLISKCNLMCFFLNSSSVNV